MKTIVLDDDPTGTQSVSHATVLLRSSAADITAAMRSEDAVYVQTNSRALDAGAAVALVRRVRADGIAAADHLGTDVRFVLRGDSTLRGHVFAETEVFLDGDAVMLFVPAFPDGGRTTRDGVHFVRLGDREVPAHDTEYAADPVFPYSTSVLVEYVAEQSGRRAVSVSLDAVRSGRFAEILRAAAPGSVIVPDAVTNADIRLIARATDTVMQGGREVIVRSASPLAAELAGVASAGPLELPLEHRDGNVLLVCGSHTAGASAQLDRVVERFGDPAIISTAIALTHPAEAGHAASRVARAKLMTQRFACVTTERQRREDHGTLGHGERVMAALTTAVADLRAHVSTVIAKGGITSAEVATRGLGARSARVQGPMLPGVSVWDMSGHNGRKLRYIVVPGNVGDPDTLVRVLDAIR